MDPLLVYITVFGTYAEYNIRSKQVAIGVVGHRLLERMSINLPTQPVSPYTHTTTKSSPSGFDMHIRPFDFVQCCVSTCVLPPLPVLWLMARRGVCYKK